MRSRRIFLRCKAHTVPSFSTSMLSKKFISAKIRLLKRSEPPTIYSTAISICSPCTRTRHDGLKGACGIHSNGKGGEGDAEEDHRRKERPWENTRSQGCLLFISIVKLSAYGHEM